MFVFAYKINLVFCRKIQMFSQHIQHELFQDDSFIYLASCCLQPKLSYKVNIVAFFLH
jgi:hypothetical protein